MDFESDPELALEPVLLCVCVYMCNVCTCLCGVTNLLEEAEEEEKKGKGSWGLGGLYVSCCCRDTTLGRSLQSMTPLGPCWGSCSANLAPHVYTSNTHTSTKRPIPQAKLRCNTHSCLLKFCFTRISLSSCTSFQQHYLHYYHHNYTKGLPSV